VHLSKLDLNAVTIILECCTKIENLSFIGCNTTDEIVSLLSEKMPQLTNLDISQNLTIREPVLDFPNLLALNLRNCDNLTQNNGEWKISLPKIESLYLEKKHEIFFQNHPAILEKIIIPKIYTISAKVLSGKVVFVQQHYGSTLVINIKKIVEQTYSMSITEQRLICAGKVLENNRTIDSYDTIPQEATFHVMGRLRD